ncbi:MAG: SEC-C metal-binding domain-containing protein [Bryobacteraceae bacterium]
MLFPSPETHRLRQKIARDLAAGKIDADTAVERLQELGTDAVVCLVRGNERQKAGDLDGAEWWFWKGLDLQPNQFTFYLSLNEMRRRRDPNNPLSPRLVELALWKLGVAEEIKPEVAEHFRASIGTTELDYSDPETYRMLATVQEVQRKKKEEPPEVAERLLPYLLLNDLQQQAPSMVEARVVNELKENAARSAPLLWAALRDWALHPKALDPKAVAMFVAMLGEIGGVELLPDLLELATSTDADIFLHANWAICRLGQRFPEQVLAGFRDAAPDARPALRCGIAEHVALLPDELDIQPVAQALLDGFRSFAKTDDAAYLLLVVLFAFGQRKDERGAALLGRYGDMLPKKGREWMLQMVESEDGFMPRLMAQEIDLSDIDDVCIERTLMDDEEDEDDEDEDEDDEDLDEDLDDDDEEFDEEDEDEEEDDWEPSMPVVAPPKPGRNDPCWCGSGKKYKKCHLTADEEADLSGAPAPRQAQKEDMPENDNQMHKRLGNLVLTAAHRWYGDSEMRRAFEQYFGSDPKSAQTDEESGDLFLQWYLHDYQPRSTGRTAFAEYLRREGGRLGARERAMLESMRDARYGLYEVQRVEAGRGIEVQDVYRGDRLFIHDVISSKELVKWDCLLSRVEYFEERYILAGNGQMVTRMLLGRFKEFVETESRHARQKPDEFVAANSHRIHRKLLELHSEYAKGVNITNSMGEPIEFSSATYKTVGDVSSILGILYGMEGLRDNTSADDPTGHYRFGWVETGVEGPVKSFGDIEIAAGRLRLSCSSRRRLEIGREMLEKELKRLVRHVEDRFETVEEARRRREREGPKEPPKRLDPQIENEIVLKLKAEHYAKWVDEALPALAGKTPREAVQTEEGRLAVRDLIRGIENLEERKRKEGGPALDVTDLRRTLGMTED